MDFLQLKQLSNGPLTAHRLQRYLGFEWRSGLRNVPAAVTA